MDTWDRLCILLRARKVTVEDVSNKVGFLKAIEGSGSARVLGKDFLLRLSSQAGMELRVLHAAAYCSTWYGRWNYSFGRGPFNISHKSWRKSMESVHSLKLSDIKADFEAYAGNQTVLGIIQRYQVTLRDGVVFWWEASPLLCAGTWCAGSTLLSRVASLEPMSPTPRIPVLLHWESS